MTDKLIFPSRVYILGIWTADLALTSAEVSVSCLLMLMCSWLEMNGSVIGIYLYSSYMAVPPDPGHCTSLRRAPASVKRKPANDTRLDLEHWSMLCVTVRGVRGKNTLNRKCCKYFLIFFFLSVIFVETGWHFGEDWLKFVGGMGKKKMEKMVEVGSS